jgi:tryptophanase
VAFEFHEGGHHEMMHARPMHGPDRSPGETFVPVIIEPFRIKVVEPIALTTRQARETLLREVDYNLFSLPADAITFDLLTDSGTAAMSTAQWSAMMIGDESYAGSRSFHRFERAVRDLTGYRHIIPTHQGRAAERILFQIAVKGGCVVPSNNHFDTTRANIEYDGGEALDLVVGEAADTGSDLPFKGNIDLDRLEDLCRASREHIPLGWRTSGPAREFSALMASRSSSTPAGSPRTPT